MDFVGCEDYDLWLQCARYGAVYLRIDEVLGVYNVNLDGESRNYSRQKSSIEAIVRHHCLEIPSSLGAGRIIYFRAKGALALDRAVSCWKSRRLCAALLSGFEAMVRNPWCVINYLRYLARRHLRKREITSRMTALVRKREEFKLKIVGRNRINDE